MGEGAQLECVGIAYLELGEGGGEAPSWCKDVESHELFCIFGKTAYNRKFE